MAEMGVEFEDPDGNELGVYLGGVGKEKADCLAIGGIAGVLTTTGISFLIPWSCKAARMELITNVESSFT